MTLPANRDLQMIDIQPLTLSFVRIHSNEIWTVQLCSHSDKKTISTWSGNPGNNFKGVGVLVWYCFENF